MLKKTAGEKEQGMKRARVKWMESCLESKQGNGGLRKLSDVAGTRALELEVMHEALEN
jgi:hypothetical protein